MMNPSTVFLKCKSEIGTTVWDKAWQYLQSLFV